MNDSQSKLPNDLLERVAQAIYEANPQVGVEFAPRDSEGKLPHPAIIGSHRVPWTEASRADTYLICAKAALDVIAAEQSLNPKDSRGISKSKPNSITIVCYDAEGKWFAGGTGHFDSEKDTEFMASLIHKLLDSDYPKENNV